MVYRGVPCKHAVMCQKRPGINPMLLTLGWYSAGSDMSQQVYRVNVKLWYGWLSARLLYLKHWRYCSLALSHCIGISDCLSNGQTSVAGIIDGLVWYKAVVSPKSWTNPLAYPVSRQWTHHCCDKTLKLLVAQVCNSSNKMKTSIMILARNNSVIEEVFDIFCFILRIFFIIYYHCKCAVWNLMVDHAQVIIMSDCKGSQKGNKCFKTRRAFYVC